MTGPEGFTFESAYRGEVPSRGVGPKPPCTDSHQPDQRDGPLSEIVRRRICVR
jgi:hypothetical protein